MTILPMKADNIEAWIERGYREGGAFQWARETAINAIEAHATRIEFGVEWQAVEKLGVYRRQIADNGRGMSDDELVEFMRTMGGGGKAIGDEHDNFGIGVKTSSCPWNKLGVAIVSWRDGDASMVRIVYDEKLGQYGLFEEVSEDGERMAVYQPFIDNDGIDWSAVRPDWMKDTDGTVIVFMGNTPNEDTVRGDPLRNEDGTKHISRYLNRRFWRLNQTRIDVHEFAATDRGAWPKSHTEAAEPMRMFTRTIRGAEHYIMGRSAKPADSARLETGVLFHEKTETRIHWYLWVGDKPRVYHYAPSTGFVGVMYKNELYHVSSHSQHFRSFGISEEKVRSNLWIIIEPPIHDKDKRLGVYPRGERNGLVWHAGQQLPVAAWNTHFSLNMPQPIINALRAARGEKSGALSDDAWKQDLAARYASIWKVQRYRHDSHGSRTASAITIPAHRPGGQTTPPKPDRLEVEATNKPRRPRSKRVFAGDGGEVAAREAMLKGNLPDYHRKREPIASDEPYLIAAYNPPSADELAGSVDVYVEHPVIVGMVKRWQLQYPPSLEDEVREAVEIAYCEVAVSKIAHSEQLTEFFNVQVVEEMRAPRNLTFALLGGMGEDALIAERLRRVLKVKRLNQDKVRVA